MRTDRAIPSIFKPLQTLSYQIASLLSVRNHGSDRVDDRVRPVPRDSMIALICDDVFALGREVQQILLHSVPERH